MAAAGPLHAARVAEDLAIGTVVVPPHAGVLSASGLLLSDHVHYRTRTRRLAVSDANMGAIRETVEALQAEARDYLAALGIEAEADFDRVLEMRYPGQAFEVPVPLSGMDLDRLRAEELARLFGEAHRRVFEFAKPHGDPVEVVSFRVGVRAPPPPMPSMGRAPGERPGRAPQRPADRTRRGARGRAAHPRGTRPGRDSGAAADRRRQRDDLRPAGLDGRRRRARQCDPEERGRPMKVSPVDQAVITQALIAAADEMGIKLIRSAHSPVVREAQDCSAAILDRKGRVVAQADLIPIQLGSVTHTFRACLEHHPLETLREGDFLVNNDPYAGGQHLPDIFLFSPIFLEGALVGVTATVVHHIDLGRRRARPQPGRRRRA